MGRGKYCSKKCCLSVTSLDGSQGKDFRFHKGDMPSCFKGWRFSQSRSGGNKYILLYKPTYEGSDKRGYIREHRYVIEQALQRTLKANEIVHHKDGNTMNNDINNLQVMDKREHDRMNVSLNIHKRWHERQVFPQSPPTN